jgi:4-alpha-glucanotransferase
MFLPTTHNPRPTTYFSSMIHLLWAVHNHQPVGNFDFIFERAYQRAYKPFLEVLKAHPHVRLSIHYTGILLDWLDTNHPEYLADVRTLVAAGRLEVLGGGYYEPILPMLREDDRRGQVAALSRRVEELFGEKPRGMWLAERVWEPSLVSSIADAGIEYVVLDGSHFKMVGKTDGDLDGYFETEDQGRSLKLLPIHDMVRDTIPFRPVEDVLGLMRSLNTAERVQVVFGDDGEKFGDWPETYDTVYTHGWLDRFFSAIEAEPETFAIRPLREGVDAGRSQGLIYLPPASYGEMMVWAQNPENIPRIRNVRRVLDETGHHDDAERFVRGTFWRNFLVKYPESNRMHKQALRLSAAIDKAKLPAAAAATARDHVWQGQCNCGYWHGVFGGLYLPHLRFGLYTHLIAAQRILDEKLLARKNAVWEPCDWNYDGRTEHLLHTRELLLGFTADGAIDQFWMKKTGLNLCDTLTRRREAYHANVASGGGGGTKLEDQIAAKEAGLESYLIYDRRVRETCAEWFLAPDTSFEAWRTQTFEPAATFTFGTPHYRSSMAGVVVRFEASTAYGLGTLNLTKTYTVSQDGPDGTLLEIRWVLGARGTGVRLRIVAETLFCLLAGNAHDRYVLWNDEDGADGIAGTVRRDILASHGVMPTASILEERGIHVVDEWLQCAATVAVPDDTKVVKPSAVWRDAIETVSQSEGGYERVYQGTVIAPVWDITLADGESTTVSVTLRLEENKAA